MYRSEIFGSVRQDKEYIFNASIKLLGMALNELDNQTLLKELNIGGSDYNIEDVDITIPLLASTMLFCEGLSNNEYLYDSVEFELKSLRDPFNIFYNHNGFTLIDEDSSYMMNSLEEIDSNDISEFDYKFRGFLDAFLYMDSLEHIRDKRFVNQYLNDMFDSEFMSDYKIEHAEEYLMTLRELEDTDDYTDEELLLADKIAHYRFNLTIEACKDEEYLNDIIKILEKYNYSPTGVYDDNEAILTNGEVDLSKLIIRVRNALAHNNYYLGDTRNYLHIFHHNDGKLDANFIIDYKFISNIIFKLLETVDNSLLPIKNANKIDTSIKRNYLLLKNPRKKDYINYLRQYITLSEHEMDNMFYEVRSKSMTDTSRFLNELDKLARTKIKDRLPDSYILEYLKSFNCLSYEEMFKIINDANRNDIYLSYKADRISNNPYKDQLGYINDILARDYNYVHSYPNVLYKMIKDDIEFDERELSNYSVLDGKLEDLRYSKYKLCINSVLHLMFVGNDQNRNRILEFPDLFKYIEVNSDTKENYSKNQETKDYINSKNNEISKYEASKNNYLSNLEKVKLSGNTTAITKISERIKDIDNKINNCRKDITRFETEYYTRHLRNAIAHGNITYYPYLKNGELNTRIYLTDYNEDGDVEFTARITTENLVNLVLSESYTNEVLKINKKGKVKSKGTI